MKNSIQWVIASAVLFLGDSYGGVIIDENFNDPFLADNIGKYNYSQQDAYDRLTATSNTIAFWMGTGTRAVVVDRGAGHEQSMYFNGSANLTQKNLGVYFSNIDMTHGGANNTQTVRVSWSFDILGNSKNANFDPNNWSVVILPDNNVSSRALGDLVDDNGNTVGSAVIAQTFSFTNAGFGGTEGWQTISGFYDIPAGEAGEFGMIQIRASTTGGFVSGGDGLFVMDNVEVSVMPEPAK